MTSHEEQNKEERDALERERIAFQRFQKSFFAVRRQFYPTGTGTPADESIVEFEAAQGELEAARGEVSRIVEEIRTGKRR